MTPNIADIIRHHVSLEVRCLDRLYLHAYLPKLQTSGGLCYFLHDHLGYPIPSPALFKILHDRFVTAVERFVAVHHIPVVHFEPGQRKDDVVAEYRTRFTAREGVVVLGVAQEKMRSFKAHKRPGPAVSFDFSRCVRAGARSPGPRGRSRRGAPGPSGHRGTRPNTTLSDSSVRT